MTAVILTKFVLDRFKSDYVDIDNFVFRLHYRPTFTFLAICSFIFYWNWGLGDIVDCVSSSKGIKLDDMDEICKIQGAYITYPKCGKQEVGVHTLGPYVSGITQGDPIVRHRTYQWFGMIFFLQAFAFYIPRYFWKANEDGHMKLLISGIAGPILAKETVSAQMNQLAGYLAGNMGNYEFYFIRFIACEILNLANIVTQMLLLHKHFDFLNFGPDTLQFLSRTSQVSSSNEARVPNEIIEGLGFNLSLRDTVNGRRGEQLYCYEDVSLVEQHFPIQVMCRFDTYGPTGNIQPHDAFCVLWLNALTQRIFVFLWFWFVFVFICTVMGVCYRFITISSVKVREILLKARYRMCERKDLAVLAHLQSRGDWFILYQLSKNLDHDVANDVMKGLVQRLSINKHVESQSSADDGQNH